MTTSPARNTTTSIATNDRSGPAASPRIKLYKRRIAIDHPDPRIGERLLATALGAVDRDALDGLLKQLVKASAIGQTPNEANLAFMISMMKSIAPRDSIEAMLAAQMVSVHVMAMRCAHHLACAGDLASQDSASRALAKLVRTFPAQIEALHRYRNNGERAITVESLPVEASGKAVAGHVTQPACAIAATPLAATDAEPVLTLAASEPAEASQGATA
jgi:hypothetical protein